jgi:hypothetical protein
MKFARIVFLLAGMTGLIVLLFVLPFLKTGKD